MVKNSAYPGPLPPAEQVRLFREYAVSRDPALRTLLIKHNLRLAAMFANRAGRAHDAEDLMQAATLGLMRAVDKFEPERGFKFSTYASAWIRNEIQECLRKNHIMPLSKEDSSLVNVERRNATDGDVGGMSAYVQYLNVISRPTSIDAADARQVEGGWHHDLVAVEDDHGEEQMAYTSILDTLLARLSNDNRHMMELRLEGKSYTEIAKVYGYSSELVRRRVEYSTAQMSEMVEYLGVKNPFQDG